MARQKQRPCTRCGEDLHSDSATNELRWVQSYKHSWTVSAVLPAKGQGACSVVTWKTGVLLCPKGTEQSQLPRLTTWAQSLNPHGGRKERISSYKLSFDLHVCIVACDHSITHDWLINCERRKDPGKPRGWLLVYSQDLSASFTWRMIYP